MPTQTGSENLNCQPLNVEFETYLKHKDALLSIAEGRYVVIKGEKVIGIYDDRPDAMKSAIERIGYVNMLCHKIEREEFEVWIG
jgi:hypothetical protein